VFTDKTIATPFTGRGLKSLVGIAIDGANAWVANNMPGANSINETRG
jgi:hypothetical protein